MGELSLVCLGKIGTRTYSYELSDGSVISPIEMRTRLESGEIIDNVKLQHTTSGDYFVRPGKSVPITFLEFDPFAKEKKHSRHKGPDKEAEKSLISSKAEEVEELKNATNKVENGNVLLGADSETSVSNMSSKKLVSALKGTNKKELSPLEVERQKLREAMKRTTDKEDVLSSVTCVLCRQGNTEELICDLFDNLLIDMSEKSLLDRNEIRKKSSLGKYKNSKITYNSLLVSIILTVVDNYVDNKISKEQFYIYLTDLFIGCRQELHYLGSVRPEELDKEITPSHREFYKALFDISDLLGCIRNDTTKMITGAKVGNKSFVGSDGEKNCKKWLSQIAKALREDTLVRPENEDAVALHGWWIRCVSNQVSKGKELLDTDYIETTWWWEPAPIEVRVSEEVGESESDTEEIEEQAIVTDTTKQLHKNAEQVDMSSFFNII